VRRRYKQNETQKDYRAGGLNLNHDEVQLRDVDQAVGQRVSAQAIGTNPGETQLRDEHPGVAEIVSCLVQEIEHLRETLDFYELNLITPLWNHCSALGKANEEA
jgi:hypothetical protein